MLETNKERIVLAVGAHPDDVEINCSGVLLQLKSLGFAVHIATLTLGDCGSKDLSAEKIREKRLDEAKAACELLGAEYHYVGSYDFAIFNDDRHNRLVTALLREVRPTIVLTHSPQDYIVDHETTSVLVRNACFYAPAPNYDTASVSKAVATNAIPSLYYFDVMEGIDIMGKPVAPQFYIDVSNEIRFKAEMLACHASQREWLREQHGMDEYLETMRRWCAVRGREATQIAGTSVTYAEAFRQHRGHAYPHENLLKEMLGPRVIANPEY